MSKLNDRQKETLKWLGIATAVCWTTLYLSKDLPFIGFTIILVPFIFGISLYYSNRKYLRNKSSAFILLLFAIVYFWGTVPFYELGKLLFNSNYLELVIGCMGAFILVFLVTKLALRGIRFGLLQIFMITVLPFVCILLLAYLKGQSISTIKGYLFDRFDLVVLLYQSFMTLIIVSSLSESGKAENKRLTLVNRKTSTPNIVFYGKSKNNRINFPRTAS